MGSLYLFPYDKGNCTLKGGDYLDGYSSDAARSYSIPNASDSRTGRAARDRRVNQRRREAIVRAAYAFEHMSGYTVRPRSASAPAM